MRLNKYISHHTKYSRREADGLIVSGVVTLNKKPLTDYSYDVQKDDKIFIKGKRVKETVGFTVIVYNKPKGVLVTKKDDRGRTTIYHKLPGKFRHFVPVGRLDYASEGLLLLTDNIDLSTALMQSKLERTYNLKIDRRITTEMTDAIKEGLHLDDARAGAHNKSDIHGMSFAPFTHFEIRNEGKRFTKLRVSITEGKNRELRRFFAHFGANVLDLKRISFGEISLNNLPENKVRYLTRKEYEAIRQFLKTYRKTTYNNQKQPQKK